MTGRIGLSTIGFDDVALERQIPRVGLRLLDCYHRAARKIKIHPDVSGTCIDSTDNRANQLCPHSLRLRRRGLIGRCRRIVRAPSLTTTAYEGQDDYVQTEKTPGSAPPHVHTLLASMTVAVAGGPCEPCDGAGDAGAAGAAPDNRCRKKSRC